MTRRHVVLAAGVAIAAWLALFGDKTRHDSIAEPVTRVPAAAAKASVAPVRSAQSASTAGTSPGPEPVILSVLPRDILIGSAGAARAGERLFASLTWTPPPPPPPPPAPPPPPLAPPLPFTYFGKKAEDGKWEVYLVRGEQTFIARPQTIIDGNYRVESVTPPTLSLTYMPLNQIQTLTIGGND